MASAGQIAVFRNPQCDSFDCDPQIVADLQDSQIAVDDELS